MCSPTRAQRRRGLANIFEGIDQSVVDRLMTNGLTTDDENDSEITTDEDVSSQTIYVDDTDGMDRLLPVLEFDDSCESSSHTSRYYRRSFSFVVISECLSECNSTKRRNGMHDVFENISLPERAQLHGIHCMNVTSNLQLAGC